VPIADGQAAAGAAQWKRFDAALQAAYAPLAERQATIDAQRRDNLAARTARGRIVSTLEGGYNLSALARSVAAHLRVLAG
jgi:acetoin utilization deacetylase AcuC-like enzyme